MANGDWTATPDGSILTVHIPTGVTQLQLISPAPPPPPLGGNPTVSFRSILSKTTNGGSTAGSDLYQGVDIGTPATNRAVFVLDGYRLGPGAHTSGLTIGGVQAVKVAEEFNSVQFTTDLTLWAAMVPNGATADINIQYPGAYDRATAIAVWAAYGLNSLVATAVGGSPAATGGDFALNTSPGGIIIGGAWNHGVTANQAYTPPTPLPTTCQWNGVPSDAEIWTDPTGGGQVLAGASLANLTGGSFSFNCVFGPNQSLWEPATLAAAFR